MSNSNTNNVQSLVSGMSEHRSQNLTSRQGSIETLVSGMSEESKALFKLETTANNTEPENNTTSENEFKLTEEELYKVYHLHVFLSKIGDADERNKELFWEAARSLCDDNGNIQLTLRDLIKTLAIINYLIFSLNLEENKTHKCGKMLECLESFDEMLKEIIGSHTNL